MKRPISAHGIAFTVIGAVIGAGFASGQEIWQFFCIYGPRAWLGVAVTIGIFYGLLSLLSNLSRKHKIYSYDRLIEHMAGPVVGSVFKHLFALFLWSGLTIMLAGSTVLANSAFAVPGWPVTILTAAAVFLVTYHRTSGLAKANELLMPFLIFMLGFFFIKSLAIPGSLAPMPVNTASWGLSAVLYVAFNSAVLLVVTPSLVRQVDDSAAIKGTAYACAGLGVLLIAIVYMMQKYWSLVHSSEMPMLVIAQHLIPALPWLYTTLLWIALITTAFASALGIAQYLDRYSSRPNRWMVIILAASSVLAQQGFAKLVGLLYPAMGYLCLTFYVFCGLRYALVRLRLFPLGR